MTVTAIDGDDGWCHVEVSGELDTIGSPALGAAISRLVDAGARHLEVVLRDVSFIDSSGLGTIIGAAQELERLGGQLLIGTPSPEVLRLLEITGLADRYLRPRD